ncbi:hypothetical protein HNY73_009799 [Argiope bruennichi]|uniref:Uncharacterized protein n=1 Tax=Argiope bruennichi TaxID=94029 RepID=A0A8T0FAR8_ARGBR|nr:hypothetical protein HNY73_009799 [Argiope bruennichi]
MRIAGRGRPDYPIHAVGARAQRGSGCAISRVGRSEQTQQQWPWRSQFHTLITAARAICAPTMTSGHAIRRTDNDRWRVELFIVHPQTNLPLLQRIQDGFVFLDKRV